MDKIIDNNIEIKTFGQKLDENLSYINSWIDFIVNYFRDIYDIIKDLHANHMSYIYENNMDFSEELNENENIDIKIENKKDN